MKILLHSYLPASKKINSETSAELKIIELLNKEILDKNISPCIIKMYGCFNCKNINDILPNNCEKYFKDIISKTDIHLDLCIIKRLSTFGAISNTYNILFTEVAQMTMESFLGSMYKNAPTSFLLNEEVLLNLEILLFHIVYTLAAIQDKYPSFRHNDLHLENILIARVNYLGNEEEYFRFKYKGKIFNVPNIGFMAKLIDFGRSTIDGIVDNDFINNPSGQAKHNFKYEKNRKYDLLTLIEDIFETYPLSDEIRKFLNQMVPMNIINNKVGKQFILDENHPLMKKMMIPNDILLKSNIFDMFTYKPSRDSVRLLPTYRVK